LTHTFLALVPVGLGHASTENCVLIGGQLGEKVCEPLWYSTPACPDVYKNVESFLSAYSSCCRWNFMNRPIHMILNILWYPTNEFIPYWRKFCKHSRK